MHRISEMFYLNSGNVDKAILSDISIVLLIRHRFNNFHLRTFIVYYAFYGFSYLISLLRFLRYYFLFFRFASDLNQGIEFEPEFLGSISNVTYPAGREAVLTCSVKNLGKYKVSVVIYH